MLRTPASPVCCATTIRPTTSRSPWWSPTCRPAELTYGELGRESTRFAAALADLGIGPGDRVAVLMGRSIELVVTLMGIWRRGAVLVPLSTALGARGSPTRLRAADVALVVVDADRRTKLAAGEGVPADPRWRVVVVRGEPGRRELSFEALMALYLDDSLLLPVAVGGDAPLVHVFTAGTTGPPKAVPVPVRALGRVRCRPALRRRSRRAATGPTTCTGTPRTRAGPPASTRRFSARSPPDATACSPAGRSRRLRRGGCSTATGSRTCTPVPPTSGRWPPPARPPPGLALRYASSTGEPLPPDLVTWAEEVLGHPLHDRYGQAELGIVLVDDAGCGPGTIGRPLPGWSVAVLADARDEPAPPAPSAGSPSTGRPAR